MMWGAAIPAAMPAAKSRLVSFIYLSLRPGFFVGLSCFCRPQGRENVCVSTDSCDQSKLISRQLRLTKQDMSQNVMLLED
jgi:hypothetical protein